MLILGLPYASVVSVLVGVTALIPILGAYIGTAIGAFLILVESPIKALWFVLFIIVLQQLEGNLIYPRVVGTSVGLPSMWTLVAVTIGADIMGVAGMVLMIPICSVIYTLGSEFTAERVRLKGIDPEKLKDQPPVLKSKLKEKREKIKRKREAKRAAELAAIGRYEEARRQEELAVLGIGMDPDFGVSVLTPEAVIHGIFHDRLQSKRRKTEAFRIYTNFIFHF